MVGTHHLSCCRLVTGSDDSEDPSYLVEFHCGTASRYVIQRVLGEGAAGKVYLAEDSLLGRRVVIKLLKTEAMQGRGYERFQREAMILAKHPHEAILPLLDANFEEDPPFMVTPWMSGGTLAERVMEGPLLREELIPLAARLASALDFLHSNEVLHRDIKPENVLIDESGQAFLADMGLSRVDPNQRLTLTGYVVGTPLYLAPEVIEAGTYSPQSDLFGLGGILLEAALGRRLLNPASQHEKTQALLREVPGGDLRKLLRWCLRSLPEDRPESGAALAQAFLGLKLQTQPVDLHVLAAGAVGEGEGMTLEVPVLQEGSEETLVEFSEPVPESKIPGPPGPAPLPARIPEGKPLLSRARVRKLYSGATAVLLLAGSGLMAWLIFSRFLFPPLALDPLPPKEITPAGRVWRSLPPFRIDEGALTGPGLEEAGCRLSRGPTGGVVLAGPRGESGEPGWTFEIPSNSPEDVLPVALVADERGGYLCLAGRSPGEGLWTRFGYLWGLRGEVLGAWTEVPQENSAGELCLRPLALLPQALLFFSDGALIRAEREAGGRRDRYRVPWDSSMEIHVDEFIVAIRAGEGLEFRLR